MYPSFLRISASATFCFDDGITTVSFNAVFALRMRVSMSAMGSVIMLVTYQLALVMPGISPA
jgi:hypothetical protein